MEAKAVPIDQLNLPEILYKFRDLKNDQHIETFLNKRIYVPSANEFNDPQDSKIPFRYRDEDLTAENMYLKALDVVKKNHPNQPEKYYQEQAYLATQMGNLRNPDFLKEFDTKEYEETCNTFGIFCLTPEVENFLMWSLYANSHLGFAIGYNTVNLVSTQLFGLGGEIQYKTDFPKRPLFPKEGDHLYLDMLMTKAKIWEYENEYRLIHRYGRGKVLEISEDAVAEIVFGCQVIDEDLLRFTSIFTEVYPNVKIFRMKLKEDTFGHTKELIIDPAAPTI